MSFIREFIRNPRQTGSVAASSAPVVRMVLDGMNLSDARRVVELGAGTGAVTAGLRRELPAEATLVAVELNSSFAESLRRRFRPPAVHVENRSAVELPALVDKYQLGELDAVASALPWTLMTPEDRSATLDAVVENLRPDGQFVTLACLHQTVLGPGRRLRDLLQQRFRQVDRLPVVWAAVPPMIAYRCSVPVKPVPATRTADEAKG